MVMHQLSYLPQFEVVTKQRELKKNFAKLHLPKQKISMN
jgi:hypothetical protein